MKRIRIIGLSLVTVVAFSAIVVANASAVLPEFSATSTINGVNSGVLNPVLTSGSNVIECTADTSKGETTAKSMLATKISVKFTGCKTTSGLNCTTAGQLTAGTIVTTSLHGELAYHDSTKKPNTVGGISTVPIVLLPDNGTLFASFMCSVLSVTVNGQVAGAIGPVNTSTTKFTLSFNLVGGKQELESVFLTLPPELEKQQTLSFTSTILGSTNAATQMSQDTITSTVAGEIKA